VKVEPIRKEVRSTVMVFRWCSDGVCMVFRYGAGEGLIDLVRSRVLCGVNEERNILLIESRRRGISC
jgi:hypothetical protein